MTLYSPTVPDFRYGPRAWNLCDYGRNVVRDAVDAEHPNGQNPVLFWRHGGGMIAGDYADCRDSTITTFWHFWRWLLGDYPTVAPGRHWDVCWFTSAQQTWTPFAGFSATRIERSASTFHPKTTEDCQHALASLTHYARVLGFDPNQRGGGGDSAGAWLMLLAALAPPLLGSGNQRTFLEGTREPGTHDSLLKFLLFHIGQIDWRRPGGVQTFGTSGYSGYFGTGLSDPAMQPSLDAYPEELLESGSPLAYLERGVPAPAEVAHLPGVCTIWTPQGNHVKPYDNLHDSAQQGTLDAALAACSIPRQSLTLSGQGLNNPNYPGAPSGSVLTRYQLLETFMAQRLAA
jgi:hypothetical protein